MADAGGGGGGAEVNKPHRALVAGAKLNKAKKAARAKAGVTTGPKSHGSKNAKAFGVAKVGRAHRAIQRKLDLGHRRDHAEVVDRRPVVPAPYVVVVMGPPGSGKTTLIKVRGRKAPLA